MKHSSVTRLGATLVLTLGIAVLAAACSPSGSLGTVPPLEPTPVPSLGSSDPDLTPAPSTPPPSTTPSGSPQATPDASPQGTTIVRGYFILAGEPGVEGLIPYLFEVPETKAVAGAAIGALLEGSVVQRDGFARISSAIPAGTRLLGLSISGGVATIDLSGEFAAGGGSSSARYRLGQVVFTLTQFSTVDAVSFRLDGRPVTVFGSEGIVLDGPVGRADFAELLPNIYVDRPASGAAIGNPARVVGSTDVFEATFRITLLDGDGRVVADQQAMATCGSGCRGTFDVSVAYDVADAQWGTLRVWAGSAKDGSPVSVREYPVWLTPAG